MHGADAGGHGVGGQNYDRTLIPRTYVYGRNGVLVESFDGKIDAQRAPIFQASLLRALAAVK